MLVLLTLAKAISDRRRDLTMSGVAGVLYRDGEELMGTWSR